MKLDAFKYTNKGGRNYNEDAVSFKIEKDIGMFVVADGLGGHQFGELASKTICDTFESRWSELKDSENAKWLEDTISISNNKILEIQNEKNATMKSTVVSLVIDGNKAIWANVGDSRLYYINGNGVRSITEDHSVSFKKYKAGEITRDQIATDEDQSCLLRALGSEDHSTPQFYDEVRLQPGDAFFLCSDGAWEYIMDNEIYFDYLKAENAEKWAHLLLQRLMRRIDGKNDNLSVLTVIVDA